LAPIISGLRRTPRSTAVSMITQLAPIATGPLSAVMTAPNPMDTLGPIETSPQIVAFGATRAEASIVGCLPLCSNIMILPRSCVPAQ
jgi:hypothetical protein